MEKIDLEKIDKQLKRLLARCNTYLERIQNDAKIIEEANHQIEFYRHKIIALEDELEKARMPVRREVIPFKPYLKVNNDE